MIRPVQLGDAEQIADLYNYYIANTSITFEEEQVSPGEMKKRIAEYTEYYPWIVCAEGNKIIGYAYAARWRLRSAYRHSVEVTVYIDKDHHRKVGHFEDIGKKFGRWIDVGYWEYKFQAGGALFQ